MEALMEYLKADQARGNPNAAVSRDPGPPSPPRICPRRPWPTGAAFTFVMGWAGEAPRGRLLWWRAPLQQPHADPPTPQEIQPWLQQEHKARVMAVWKKYKCNPMKSLAGMFVQAPIFIGFFTGLRAMAAAKVGPSPRRASLSDVRRRGPLLGSREPVRWLAWPAGKACGTAPGLAC